LFVDPRAKRRPRDRQPADVIASQTKIQPGNRVATHTLAYFEFPLIFTFSFFQTTTTTMAAATDITEEAIKSVLTPTLSRLTECLPKAELDIIIREARACENALEREIELLEAEIGISEDFVVDGNSNNKKNDNKKRKANNEELINSPEGLQEPSIAIPLLPTPYQPGGGTQNYLDDVDGILGTEFSPPDRYFTVSALLGRLRVPLKLPATTSAAAAARAAANNTTTTTKSKKEEMEAEKKAKQTKLSFERQQALLTLETNDVYHMDQPDTVALLALWKRISSHRTATVFRKPVNPAEAPGYTDRIHFPIDLSLIRKMIVARMIKSFASLHRCVGLICHNCVKFNGRESDYAALTRDFEDNVDEKVLEAVRNATAAAASTAATVSAAPAATAAANAPAASAPAGATSTTI
jgi:hypothetical protein